MAALRDKRFVWSAMSVTTCTIFTISRDASFRLAMALTVVSDASSIISMDSMHELMRSDPALAMFPVSWAS